MNIIRIYELSNLEKGYRGGKSLVSANLFGEPENAMYKKIISSFNLFDLLIQFQWQS